MKPANPIIQTTMPSGKKTIDWVSKQINSIFYIGL
jgi:hypothetical protein